MEGLRAAPPDVATEYQPMRSCDSDDSQSNASRSEDNEAIPGIIYTSDDSADVGQCNSTYIDSDIPNYIAQNVNQRMEDELSQQFLLETDMIATPQPSPQVGDPFTTHPQSPVNMNMNGSTETGGSLGQGNNPRFNDMPIIHLQVKPAIGEGLGLTRSNSTSSSSTEAEFTAEAPFLTEYEPLPQYAEDVNYTGGLNFDAMNDDPVKSKVIHAQLNTLNSAKETKPNVKPNLHRFYVGDVPIDARYEHAFFVKWNWPRIRQTCVFANMAILVACLCLGVGLVINMPKGTDCNPGQEWWQGTASYHVFVPSFLDTDGDGFGDLNGVIAKLDYLQDLGVKTVRLAPIFEQESFVARESPSPTNYTRVSPMVGDARDLHLLAALLHERDMFLILDVPLATERAPHGAHMPALDLVEGVSLVLSHWMSYGVDGFVFSDLDKVAHVGHPVIEALRQWRALLQRRSRGRQPRVMMVPVEFLTQLERTSAVDLQNVLSLVHLIDVRLDLKLPAQDVALAIQEATRWDEHHSLPWINWRIGGPFEPRIADSPVSDSSAETLPTTGFTLLQLFLPGTVTIYYGDEIGLTQGDNFKRDLSWATPMSWSPEEGGGFSAGEAWLSAGKGARERNVDAMNATSLQPIRTMVHASQEQVPLYINGIFNDVGTFHPKKSTNYKIRYASGDLLILDRFYPRRNKYAIVANLGSEALERDLSKLYYGGKVLASSHGKTGYVRFKHITLQPREALALMLDK